MEKLKKVITRVSVAAILLIWYGSVAHSDYTWSKLIIKQKLQQGWVVGAIQANFVDITHPWTIFKQPIVRIAFVNPNELTKFDNRLLFAKVLWVNHANLSRTEGDIFSNLFDCRNNKNAFIDSNVSVKQIDFMKLEWKENANTSNIDIAKVVCS